MNLIYRLRASARGLLAAGLLAALAVPASADDAGFVHTRRSVAQGATTVTGAGADGVARVSDRSRTIQPVSAHSCLAGSRGGTGCTGAADCCPADCCPSDGCADGGCCTKGKGCGCGAGRGCSGCSKDGCRCGRDGCGCGKNGRGCGNGLAGLLGGKSGGFGSGSGSGRGWSFGDDGQCRYSRCDNCGRNTYCERCERCRSCGYSDDDDDDDHHCPGLCLPYLCGLGHLGGNRPVIGCYTRTYALDPNYHDPRDGQIWAAQGYNAPISVPLAPNVEYTMNYGWGIPSSRLTPVSRPATGGYAPMQGAAPYSYVVPGSVRDLQN